MEDSAERQLLYSPQAERALCGCALINPSVLDLVHVPAEALRDERHRLVWQACLSLHDSGKDIDLLIISELLDRANKLEEVGGPAYLTELLVSTPDTASVENYAAVVLDYATRRQALQVATELAASAYKLDERIETGISRATDILFTAGTATGTERLGDVVNRVVEQVEERAQNPSDVWGIPTGFPDLDNLLGGLHTGEVMLLTGQPGAGKSLLALQTALNAAAGGNGKMQYGSGLYILEMSNNEVGYRALGNLSLVPTRALRSGYLKDDDWSNMMRALGVSAQLPVFLNDDPDMTLGRMRADLARLKRQHGIKLFVVDFLLLVGGYDHLPNETEKSNAIARGVKAIARRLDLAGILINSVTKEGMDTDKVSLTHSRGGGDVLHAVDVAAELVNTNDKVNGVDKAVDLVITKVRAISGTKHRVRLVQHAEYPYFSTPTVSSYVIP